MSGSPFGALEYLGAKEAGKSMERASNLAAQTETAMYNQARGDLAPWRIGGENALAVLQGVPTYSPEGYTTGMTGGLMTKGPGEFKESPSYQFPLQEGLKAVQRQASATGRMGSGAYLKDITKYAEGMASNEYQNFLNRYYQSLNPWLSMAGMGQISAGQSANTSMQAGNTLSNIYQNMGTGQAASILGAYNALSKSMGQAGSALGNYFTGGTMGFGQGIQSGGGWGGWGDTMAGSGAGANAMMWL